jgi:hypothetical protein
LSTSPVDNSENSFISGNKEEKHYEILIRMISNEKIYKDRTRVGQLRHVVGIDVRVFKHNWEKM